jgi:glycosyltransferase involved in cell wall biosynthesis
VVNNDHPYVQAALPSLGCPVIVICHAMRWATASLAVYNHEAATSVVAISYDMWADLLRRGVDIHKVAVLQNGIADRAPSWEPRAGVEQPLRVVFAGNWSRVKGGDRLIEALGAAPSWAASIRLDCFGDGSLMKKAARYESDWCGIHGRVPRESFLSVLSSADMLLLPSRVEGCPMTVIEALCYGVVPIVSDGPGAMRWMVRSGLDGFVVRGSRWARDMWSVIGEVIGNRARLAEMSLLSRRRYEQNYRIEGVAESLLALAQAPSKRTGVVTRAVKWHRPVRGVGGVPGLVARLAYRSGAIRTSVVRK